MSTFALVTASLSLALFAAFVILSVLKFGLTRSYSAYAARWNEAVPMATHTYLWSIVTIVAGILLLFAMIERGAGNPLQFLGFFAPLYLFVAGFTPEYQDDGQQKKVHVFGAVACAVVSLVWLIVICGKWWLVPCALVAAGTAAFFTKTYKTSYIFWSEMAMFTAVYAAVYIG